MDLEKDLLTPQSKFKKDKICKYIGTDKTRFKELVNLFLTGNDRIQQCAGWPLSDHSIEHPELIKPYLDKIIPKIYIKEQHTSIARNILRIFEYMEIPEKHEGKLLEYCFVSMRSEQVPIAVRALCITIATRLCKKYPELRVEFDLIADELLKHPLKPALKVRLRRAAR